MAAVIYHLSRKMSKNKYTKPKKIIFVRPSSSPLLLHYAQSLTKRSHAITILNNLKITYL